MTTNWLTQRERLRELRDAALKREDTPKRAAIPWRFENLGSGFGTIWNGTGQSVVSNVTEQSGRYFIAAHEAVPQLLAEVERLEAENEKLREDVTAAAGELLVEMPPPGSDMGRVMIANALMRRERDALRAEVERLRAVMTDAQEDLVGR